MRPPYRVARIAAALLISALLFAATAGIAQAAPSAATMSLSELRQKLDASKPVRGYMRTVLQGSEIATIEVDITAIGDGSSRASNGVIVFETTATVIENMGGIASGMSGSPISVDDSGTMKVVGAVSLGGDFMLGGMGGATPIENMLDIQRKYAPAVVPLEHPIITPAGVIDRIVVTGGTSKLSGTASDGAAVMRPLSTPVFVKGLPRSSRLFKRASTLAEKAGRNLFDLGGLASAPAPGDTSFETTLVPGAAVAAHETRGDFLWYGFGTVTYTDSETVLAYGHANTHRGNSDIYMSNAWVDGIWKSSWYPYKMGRLGALKGTITQDRDAGIMGVTGQYPDETMITAEATNTDTGEATHTVTYMPRSILSTVSTGDEFDEQAVTLIPAYSAFPAGARLFDQYHTPGSALTTTTVRVRDAEGTHTITMPNCIDDSYDIPSALIWDAETAVSSLQALLENGVDAFEILDIDVQSSISTRRNYAEIVGVYAPNALHTGDNRVNISALAYGQAATQTIPATITIPAGVTTTGYLTVAASGSGSDVFPSDDATGDPRISARDNLASVVQRLNSQLPGNAYTLRYTPVSSSDGAEGEDDEGSSDSIQTTGTAPWTLDGEALASPVIMNAMLEERTMDCGGFNFLEGQIQDGPKNMGPVALYGTPAGKAESLIETAAADAKTGEFGFGLYGLTRNTTLRLHVDGVSSQGYLPTDSTLAAYVRPSMRLKTSSASVRAGRRVTLTATVWPAENAGSKVTFEYYKRGSWRKIAAKTLANTNPARASISWKVPRGSTKVRARFHGSAYNVASASGSKTIKGR